MRVCYGQLFFKFTFAMLYLFLISPNTNPYILYLLLLLVARILGLGGAIIAIYMYAALYEFIRDSINSVLHEWRGVDLGTLHDSNYLEKLYDR